LFSYLSRRSLARAPFRVAVSVATALAILGAGGFMALPKAPDAMPPATLSVVEASAPTVQPVAAAKPADLNCLTKAVYYEARGESAEGQAAVAQVVLNRTRRPTYPSNVCGVVFQNGCQFSFVCNGAMRRPLEPAAWTRARRVASDALGGHVMRAVGQALSFHVAALGSEGRGQIARIGGHVFFVPGRARAGASANRPIRILRFAGPPAATANPVAAVARDAAATVPVVVAANSETAPSAEVQ
jgi:hypothetical protein